jgi:hypothetical protein
VLAVVGGVALIGLGVVAGAAALASFYQAGKGFGF